MDKLTKVFIILAGIGIVDAIYHAYDEISNYANPITHICNINSWWSCTSVFNSGYDYFPPQGGLPMWAYGIIWFPLMLVLGLWFARRRGGINGIILLPILMVGNFFTFYLWYLELGVIHAICPVCVSLYVLNYAMTGIAVSVGLRQD